MPPNGLEAIFLGNRDKLLRFLAARGAGEEAQDVLHDMWLKLSGRQEGPIGNPLAYLYRAAETTMIDRYRSRRQAEQRERDWHETTGRDGSVANMLSGEGLVAARQEVAQVAATLAALGSRCETVFRRARLDGVSQRQIADELGVSLSTVESDLRIVARALIALKERVR